MLLVIYGINHLFETNTPSQRSWTTFQSVMYNCFSKSLWSLSLGWVIFSCHKGYGGLINNFLSWKAWMPISKLTYGAYLIHPVLQKIVLTGITSSIKYSTFFWVILYRRYFEHTIQICFNDFSLNYSLEKHVLSLGQHLFFPYLLRYHLFNWRNFYSQVTKN